MVSKCNEYMTGIYSATEQDKMQCLAITEEKNPIMGRDEHLEQLT